MTLRWSVLDGTPVSWYNSGGQMGEPSLGSNPLSLGCCLEELPDSQPHPGGVRSPHETASGGRPAKAAS
jgi:hypothetical protein